MSTKKIKSTVEKVKDVLNLPQPDSETTIWLMLDGKEYELRSFATEFGRGTDHKGQPQQNVKGGLLYLSLYQIPDDNINRWMIQTGALGDKSGEIQFRKQTSNMPLRIEFFDAQCINYQKEIGYKDIGMEVKLVISPKEISLNGIEHSNVKR